MKPTPKYFLLLFLLMIPVIGMAQDRTKTKNNDAEIYDNLYDIYQETKKHRSDSLCLQLSDSMRALAIQQGDKRAIAMSYAHPLSYYLNQDDETRFLEHVELLTKASEEAELWSFYYYAFTQKSIYYLRHNQVAETIEMAEQMMKKAYEENNQNGIYSSHCILVNCYQQMRLYDVGLKEAEKSMQAEIGLPDNKFGNSMGRMAEIYLEKHDYQGCLDVIEKYGDMVENISAELRLQEYRCLCFYNLKKDKEFLQSYQKLLSMYDSYGESTGSHKNVLRVMYLSILGKQKEAVDELHRLSLERPLFNLFRFYKEVGDVESLCQLLQDEEANWEAAHNQLYEADLKKYSLELDNQNLKLREEEMLNNQHNMRIYVVLGMFGVLLLFGGILYWREQRSNRQLHKANSQLEEQKHQLEEQLIAVKEANMASDAKTSFLFNMSHDIRTPMNAILGFANLLEKQKDNPDVVSNYLNKIKSSGQFLLSLINNVLDMARIESGKMELDEDFYDLLDTKNTPWNSLWTWHSAKTSR